jgi:hypothetical protein
MITMNEIEVQKIWRESTTLPWRGCLHVYIGSKPKQIARMVTPVRGSISLDYNGRYLDLNYKIRSSQPVVTWITRHAS